MNNIEEKVIKLNKLGELGNVRKPSRSGNYRHWMEEDTIQLQRQEERAANHAEWTMECQRKYVHGIPYDFMEKETGILIGEMLGVLVEAEEPKTDGVLRRTYLRIRVSINITKALPTGFWLDRENLPPLWVFFKYERLPDSYCFNCGILGYEKKTCKNLTAMACWDPTKKKYAPGLGVSQGRSGPTMGGGTSEQGGWRQDGEEQAREQRNPERERE
ncbi:uncharacterized protein DS421_13g420520 [Arachis hypogaea]|nr:uncharacterized protein DS421_13g420520 [Arachis hypogaea]